MLMLNRKRAEKCCTLTIQGDRTMLMLNYSKINILFLYYNV